MKRIQGKVIIGSAIGLTTLALAIDHTRHRLPDAEPQQYTHTDSDNGQKTPCSPDSPCSLDEAPRSPDDNPCSLDDNPCDLDDNPCDLEASPCNLDYSA